jgi:hypothetical protein
VIVGPAMVATETACCPKFPHSVHLAPARKQLSAHLVEVGQRKHGAPDAPACADRKAAVIQDSLPCASHALRVHARTRVARAAFDRFSETCENRETGWWSEMNSNPRTT